MIRIADSMEFSRRRFLTTAAGGAAIVSIQANLLPSD